MDHEEGGGGHDSSERWLVSYADFITLLFALFVLLYALSMQSSDQVNRAWVAMATGVGMRPHRGGLRPELGESARGGSSMSERSNPMLMATRQRLDQAVAGFSNSGVTTTIDSSWTGYFTFGGTLFCQWRCGYRARAVTSIGGGGAPNRQPSE